MPCPNILPFELIKEHLTYWGRVTPVCISNLTINRSDNSLSPGRRQAIIRTNAGMLLIGPLVTNLSEILIEIHTFLIQENAFHNVVCKMVAILSRPQCVNKTWALLVRYTSNFLLRFIGMVSFFWSRVCVVTAIVVRPWHFGWDKWLVTLKVASLVGVKCSSWMRLDHTKLYVGGREEVTRQVLCPC